MIFKTASQHASALRASFISAVPLAPCQHLIRLYRIAAQRAIRVAAQSASGNLPKEKS
jgi:hypothetical protein